MATIVLTGPKHSGKTSTGKALADLLSGLFFGFFDLDEYIEKQTGKSPRALYREGPEVFQKAETAALEDLLNAEEGRGNGPSRIIAAGGGIIDNPEALKLLNKGKPVLEVYLEVSAETAWERIRRSAGETGELPPFLDTPNPEETHRALHARRAAAYREQARFTLNAEGKSPEHIAGEIYELLRDFLPGGAQV
jgi:shikimate kinase